MCPVCIATVAIIAAKATGSGGAALVAGRFLKRNIQTTIPKSTAEMEVHNGYHDNGIETGKDRAA
jgi:hypothetical protein